MKTDKIDLYDTSHSWPSVQIIRIACISGKKVKAFVVLYWMAKCIQGHRIKLCFPRCSLLVVS